MIIKWACVVDQGIAKEKREDLSVATIEKGERSRVGVLLLLGRLEVVVVCDALGRNTNGPKVIYNNEVRVERVRFALLFFACSFIYLSRYKKMTAISDHDRPTPRWEGGDWSEGMRFGWHGPSMRRDCPVPFSARQSCRPSCSLVVEVVACPSDVFPLFAEELSHCHQFRM